MRSISAAVFIVLVYLFPPPNTGDDAGTIDAAIVNAAGPVNRTPERNRAESGTHTSTFIIHPAVPITPPQLPVPWSYGNGVTVTTLPTTDGRQVPVTIVVMPGGAPLTGAQQAAIRGLLRP